RTIRAAAALDVVRRPRGATAARARRVARMATRADEWVRAARGGRRSPRVLRPRWLDPRRGLPTLTTSLPTVELGPLGLDGGAHVLVKLALSDMRPGDALAVCGTHPELTDHLAVWCRSQGHRWTAAAPGSRAGGGGGVERGHSAGARWIGAVRAGHADAARPDALASTVPADWGLAPRGAAIEPGGPTPSFRLDRRDELWTDRATALYRQAAAAQWDPDAAIDWDARIDNAPAVEAAVVQVMTFLVENEEAALVVPA